MVKGSVHPSGSLLKRGERLERIGEVRELAGGRITQPRVATLVMSHWALNRPPPRPGGSRAHALTGCRGMERYAQVWQGIARTELMLS